MIMGYLLFYFSFIMAVISGNYGTRPKDDSVSELLSKFHQNDYKLTYERSELIRSNASYGDFHYRTFKFNRTTPALNATLTFYLDVGYAAEIIAQLYRFASNEYREFPVRFEINVCQALAEKAFGMDKLAKDCGNIVCPLIKGKKYNVFNFAPDGSKFPPFIPNGKYMLEFQFMYHSQEAFVVNNYATIDRPIPYI